jgi:type I site-specific restriction endonuclease
VLIFTRMPTATKVLTIGDLEAGFSTYCQALRRLVAEGREMESIRRTICWDYLNRLHTSLPQSYRSPEDLVQRYQRAQTSAAAN